MIHAGHDVLLRVDVQGAASIRSKVPQAVLIFLTVPSLDALEQRLRKRNTETEEQLRIRLANAREEMRRQEEFDYLVFNDENRLDDAAERVKAIVLAEKCRLHRAETTL